MGLATTGFEPLSVPRLLRARKAAPASATSFQLEKVGEVNQQGAERNPMTIEDLQVFCPAMNVKFPAGDLPKCSTNAETSPALAIRVGLSWAEDCHQRPSDSIQPACACETDLLTDSSPSWRLFAKLLFGN
jgi:hypothetical protein